MCEVGMVYSELDYMLKHIRKFSRPRRVHTPIAQAVSKSYVQPVPKGNILIMSPWNYPFLLTMDPLIDAIAAGNTAIIKPSAYAPYTSDLIQSIIKKSFPERYVAVVTGGRAENQALLNERFHHIFFTGSQAVGKTVLEKAARFLTPVSLELGGKSPCIVDKTADLKVAARRIIFGKFLNCGQTCVAPDYICCDESVVKEFSQYLIAEIKRQYGEHPLSSESYGKIINEKHFSRLDHLLKESSILYGGDRDEEKQKIGPTIVSPCTWEDPVMQEEIFGPVLPILTYSSLEEVLSIINSRPHPLAFYLFSKDKKVIDQVTKTCPFGGGCVNDTIIHLATSQMGFGGFMESGMGSYHGKTGFETFTHYKSIVNKKTWLDLPMRYQPYNKINDTLIRWFLK